MTAPEEPDGKKLKGTHVLLMFLAFFGLMFVVNGIFLHSAITSFPGEDVEKSYVQGLAYNSTLAARRAQDELGWQAQAGLEAGVVLFRLEDADGAPLAYKHVTGRLKHVADAGLDQEFELTSTGQGEYSYTLPAALSRGKWTLEVHVRNAADGESVFEARKVLFVS